MPRSLPSSSSSIPTTDQLRRAIIDGCAQTEHQPRRLRGAARGDLRRAGWTGVLDRVEAAITPHLGLAGPGGRAGDDVAPWWTHVVTLHRKQRTLK